MSEVEFLSFHYVLMSVEGIFYGICMAAFLGFMTHGKSGRQKYFLSGIVFTVYTAVFFCWETDSGFGWMRMVLVILLLTVCAKFWGMDWKLIFLLGVIYFCIKNLSMIILFSVTFCGERRIIMNAGTPEQVFRYAAWSNGIAAVLQMILLAAMLSGVGCRLKKREIKLHLKELCVLLLTPAMGIGFVNLILQLLVVSKEDTVFQLYEEFPHFLWVVPLAAVLLYGGILAAVDSCQRMIELQEEGQRSYLEQQQIKVMRERMKEVEQFCGSIRQMRHEMRNHLANIQGLVESGSCHDMESYAARMDESMKAFELPVRTGNVVMDVIISDKERAAARQGVDFLVEFSFPGSGGYEPYDIGIIVSNLLENALEACAKMSEEKRCITLFGRRKKGFFLIQVRNSFQGEVVFDQETKLPVSTKGEEKLSGGLGWHGVGLLNVRQEAEKYGGNVDIQVDEHEFCVTVLLQERTEGG